MDYFEIIRRVRKLDFIRNDQTANAAVNAVLDTLTSSLNDEQANKLAEKFPEHHALSRLGGDRKRMEAISVADYTAGICAQFRISRHQARTLVRNVLYFTKEVSGANAMMDIKKGLPADWAEALQNA